MIDQLFLLGCDFKYYLLLFYSLKMKSFVLIKLILLIFNSLDKSSLINIFYHFCEYKKRDKTLFRLIYYYLFFFFFKKKYVPTAAPATATEPATIPTIEPVDNPSFVGSSGVIGSIGSGVCFGETI